MGPVSGPTPDDANAFDADLRAERIQAQVLRGMSAARRLAICVEWTKFGVEASRSALARARPDLRGEALLLEWARLHYGTVPGRVRRDG